MIEIPVYSEQTLTPRAAEVVRGVLDDGFGIGEIRFRRAQFGQDQRVLVFGKAPNVTDTEMVFTYSVAQLMSKANAASVLRAGVRQFISEPEVIPFLGPIGITNPKGFFALDPTLPTAIDIETSGNLGKEHTPEEVGLLSVAFYQPGLAPLVLHPYQQGDTLSELQLQGLRAILPQFTKGIWHNGKFDIRVLRRILGEGAVAANFFDTMLAHHVLNHAAGDHKLKSLARRYVGAPEWEVGLKTYLSGGGHFENIPLDKLVEYNGWDVYWTYKLYEFLEPQIMQDDNNVKAFMLEMSAAEFLLEVEKVGIPWDQEYADHYGAQLVSEAALYKETLQKWVGPKFNPASPQQVKAHIKTFGTVVDSTDEKALKEIIADQFAEQKLREFCTILLSYRKVTKTYNTYVKGWQQHVRHGRVHPTFLVHGTSTGRLSSSSPNAQNMPREKAVRKLVGLGADDSDAIS